MKQDVNKTIIEVKKDIIEEDLSSLNLELLVPSIPPSNIGSTCNIISINYAFKLQVKVERM